MTPPVIELARSEILKNLPSNMTWEQLDAQKRRFLAASILRQRGDAHSLDYAGNIEAAVPLFNTFTILEDVGRPMLSRP